MANKKRLLCDKTEILGIANRMVNAKAMKKRKLGRFSLTYDRIKSIKFEKFEEKKLFKKVPSEKILIYETKSPYPYEILKSQEKEFFDEYKKELIEFAERNRLLLYDNTQE